MEMGEEVAEKPLGQQGRGKSTRRTLVRDSGMGQTDESWQRQSARLSESTSVTITAPSPVSRPK